MPFTQRLPPQQGSAESHVTPGRPQVGTHSPFVHRKPVQHEALSQDSWNVAHVPPQTPPVQVSPEQHGVAPPHAPWLGTHADVPASPSPLASRRPATPSSPSPAASIRVSRPASRRPTASSPATSARVSLLASRRPTAPSLAPSARVSLLASRRPTAPSRFPASAASGPPPPSLRPWPRAQSPRPCAASTRQRSRLLSEG